MKKFEFLPNGQTISEFKGEAKKLHKSGCAESHSDALNKLSKMKFNIAYNKLSPSVHVSSPRIVDSVLYVPIEIDLRHFDGEGFFHYYVAMNSDVIALTRELKADISSHEVNVANLKHGDFSKDLSGNGWWITFSNICVGIKATDEGIVCDVVENGEVIESTYAFHEELYSGDDVFGEDRLSHIVPFNILGQSDYKASHILGHKCYASRTRIFTFGGLGLCLYGTFLVDTGDSILDPDQMVSMVIADGLSESRFFNWLQSSRLREYYDYEVVSSPFFRLEDGNGNEVGEIFGLMPLSLTEAAFMIAHSFIG